MFPSFLSFSCERAVALATDFYKVLTKDTRVRKLIFQVVEKNRKPGQQQEDSQQAVKCVHRKRRIFGILGLLRQRKFMFKPPCYN